MKFFLTIVFLLSNSVLVIAQSSETEDTFSKVITNTFYRVLPNGLRVVIYPRHQAPVFAGFLSVRVGGSDEIIGNTGISHMLEHMAFKGTDQIGSTDPNLEEKLLAQLEDLMLETNGSKDFDAQQAKRWNEINVQLDKITVPAALERENIRRGASGANATTDNELTNYYINFPKGELEYWCWEESEKILNSRMREFYQERDVVMEERRMRNDDSPEGRLYELLLGTVFLRHPYQNPVIGYEFDIQRLRARQLQEFKDTYYVPSNMALALVGDLDKEATFKIVEKYFSRIPVGPNPPRPIMNEPPQKGERIVKLEAEASAQIFIGYRKPIYPHADDPALSIMLTMLAGGRTSILYKELVDKQKVALTVGYDEGPGQAYPNMATFIVTPSSSVSNDRALRAFDQVIDNFKKSPLDMQQFEIAHKNIETSLISSLSSNMGLAMNFAESILLYNDWKEAFDWYESTRKVSAQEVLRVGRQYLQRNLRSVAMLEPVRQ